MKHIKITAFIVLAFFSVSASCDERKGNVQEQQEGTLPPVETQPPNTRYKPAFEGQTRIAGVKTSTPYRATVISSSLSSPWAVTPLPDGRLVITEKSGTLRIATTDGTISNKITGFPEVDDRQQGGLLDVAPAPDFTTTRMLYFTLAERTSQGSLTAVGKGRLSTDETVIENFKSSIAPFPISTTACILAAELCLIKAGIFLSPPANDRIWLPGLTHKSWIQLMVK